MAELWESLLQTHIVNNQAIFKIPLLSWEDLAALTNGPLLFQDTLQLGRDHKGGWVAKGGDKSRSCSLTNGKVHKHCQAIRSMSPVHKTHP